MKKDALVGFLDVAMKWIGSTNYFTKDGEFCSSYVEDTNLLNPEYSGLTKDETDLLKELLKRYDIRY